MNWLWKYIPVIVPLYGGFGNQLYIFATAYAYSKRVGRPLILLDYWYHGAQRKNKALENFRRKPILLKYLENLDITVPNTGVQFFMYYFIRVLVRLQVNNSLVCVEKDIFAQSDLSSNYLIILNGLFQNPIFFHHEFDDLKMLFVGEHLEKTDRTMCHLRLGDNVVRSNDVSGILDPDYFDQVVDKYFRGSRANFSYFSDSNELAISLYDIPVDQLDMSTSLTETFSSMLQCKHFIVGNSTLSWWAAYLGHDVNSLIVYPRPFYRDRYDNVSSHFEYFYYATPHLSVFISNKNEE